jgi:hypothetical protein
MALPHTLHVPTVRGERKLHPRRKWFDLFVACKTPALAFARRICRAGLRVREALVV